MSNIPNFNSDGNLPPGIHETDWESFVENFGYNSKRKMLIGGLKKGLNDLSTAGCNTVYIDGSFVTTKELPGDFDACWSEINVDLSKLNPVLKIFDNHRAAQKAKYYGEFFPAIFIAEPISSTMFLDFFQKDKNTGKQKGIIKLNLDSYDKK